MKIKGGKITIKGKTVDVEEIEIDFGPRHFNCKCDISQRFHQGEMELKPEKYIFVNKTVQ